MAHTVPNDFPALVTIALGLVVVVVILARGSSALVTASDEVRAVEVASSPGPQEEQAATGVSSDSSQPSGQVTATATAAVVVDATQASVTLTGTVSEAAIAEELVARAEQIYPSDEVDDRLLADETSPVAVAITIRGSLSDRLLFDRIRTGFSGIVGAEIVSIDEFVLSEPSELQLVLDDLAPIRFRSRSSAIAPESDPTLDRVAALLNDNPDVVIEIGGHTDSKGSEAVNQLFSQFRADAVRSQLVARGVTNTMRSRGFGESRLEVSPDDSEEARQVNRRIEFRIISA